MSTRIILGVKAASWNPEGLFRSVMGQQPICCGENCGIGLLQLKKNMKLKKKCITIKMYQHLQKYSNVTKRGYYMNNVLVP
jgi:hypothetical protein